VLDPDGTADPELAPAGESGLVLRPSADTVRFRPDEQRYARGNRRTDAEPLAASWRPGADPPTARPAAGTGGNGDRERGWLAAYGWRIYAIPVLALVTILVVVNLTGPSNNALGSAATAAGTPEATEGGATAVNPTGGTAVLPAGGTYAQSGTGTWRILPGNSPVVGKPGARVYHYQVAVEDGIDPAVYAGDDAFTQTVQAIVADPRGWLAAGSVDLQQVDSTFATPDFTIELTTPDTDHRADLCGFVTRFEASCWVPAGKKVVLNVARWVRGALAFDGDLGLYREYTINHEVGEVLGDHDVGCATDGGLAPVMMEQTYGVADDYVYDVNNVEPGARGALRRDDKVCRVNAWPYPQGGGYSPADPPS
jgi:hypothetical protein